MSAQSSHHLNQRFRLGLMCLLMLLSLTADDMGTRASPLRQESPPPAANTNSVTVPDSPSLADELNRMAAADQEVRAKWIKNPHDETLIADMRRIDVADTARMKQIVAQYGWPGRKLVGEEAAQNAWLLVQHADQDHAFQKKCLSLMSRLVARGDVRKQDYALLTDRVLRAEGKKQRYGTQFTSTPEGEWVMQPTEDEKHLDQRRKSMGLPPIAEYAKLIQKMYSPEKQSNGGASVPAPPVATSKSNKP